MPHNPSLNFYLNKNIKYYVSSRLKLVFCLSLFLFCTLPSVDISSKYEGRTESHEQLFFCMRTGKADEGECGGKWNQLLCYL